MTKRKLVIGVFLTLSLLSACGKIENGTSKLDPKKTGSNATIATGSVSSDDYQALLVDGKYKTSVARGASASRLNSNYNLTNFEKGLQDISKESYPLDNYLFQEGQKLKSEILSSWLGRKSGDNPDGLNPESGAGPIVFQQLVEQDYIDSSSQNLAGLSLGIALNQVDYSDSDNPTEIDAATIEAEGKRVAEQVLIRVREIEGLEKLSITIGLFKQAKKEDISGGSYFAKTVVKSGTQVGDWQEISEEYLILPVDSDGDNSATADGLSNKYRDFKTSIQGFFPNLSGITGIAHYRSNQLVKLTIKIETKYFSPTEIISFTQYVGKTVDTFFNMNANIDVQINSIEGPQAFVSKTVGTDKAVAHIFD